MTGYHKKPEEKLLSKQLTIALTQAQYERLSALASADGVSCGEIIRRMLSDDKRP